MQAHFFPSSPVLLSAAIIFVLLTLFSASHGEDDYRFSNCSRRVYSCGQTLKDIGYPFWGSTRPGFCGLPGFQLTCHSDRGNYSTIQMASQTFRVLSIDPSIRLMRLARDDLWDDVCPREMNFNIPSDDNNLTFLYSSNIQNIRLFYNCSSSQSRTRYAFTCPVNGINNITGFFSNESSPSPAAGCEFNMTVPVIQEAMEEFLNNETMTLQELLNRGFYVEYGAVDNRATACSGCRRSGGLCWSETFVLPQLQPNATPPSCLCRDGPQPFHCPHTGSGLNWRGKIAVGFGAAGISIIIMCIIFVIYHRRFKKKYTASVLMSHNHPYSSYSSSTTTDLEKTDNYHGVPIFDYNELEEATNNFDSSKELGDGGYGTVYKGKLRDGRDVAVKRLYENNFKRVNQFMNEVEILTRLRHQNLVTLYGCTSRHSRDLLLVYEYIPNGTVADHIHGEQAKPGFLTWNTRMNIAVETASALAYLHASDVVHRDVKTTNILLDNSFCVKVADFGLSRLFPNHATHISTAPQGTPGYVDPEYHQCYKLTDRSDVYSFGVVLIELISSMPAVDITRHHHEINLSNMAISKIQAHALHELVDSRFGFDADKRVMSMISDVAELAFRCLQNCKEMRPSMVEVLEELKRIQNKGQSPEKEKSENSMEDCLLLKGQVQTLSPDSVIAPWNSRKTTPSSSI